MGKFKVDDVCVVTEDSMYFKKGDTVVVKRGKEDECYMVSHGKADKNPIVESRLRYATLAEGGRPRYGVKYLVTSQFALVNKGSVVTLDEDDGTHLPYFNSEGYGRRVPINLSKLTELNEENNMSGKLTMDMVKSGDVIMVDFFSGAQKRLVVEINGKLQQVGRSGWADRVMVEDAVALYRGSDLYDVKRVMFENKEPHNEMKLIWKKEDEVKEFSMQEIADKMGVSVESLRIKE